MGTHHRIQFILGILIASNLQLSSGIALAASGSGNGGNGIKEGNHIYLLDFVDVGIQKAPFFDPSVKPNLDLRTRILTKLRYLNQAPVDQIAQKITEISLYDGVVALGLVKAIEAYQWRHVNLKLKPTHDDDDNLDFKSDQKVQLAVRSGEEIQIDENLWKKLDNDNRAGLILHEVIYAMMIPERYGSDITAFRQSSPHAREIVGYIFHPELKDAGASQFEKVLSNYFFKSSQNVRLKEGTDYVSFNPVLNFEISDYKSEKKGRFDLNGRENIESYSKNLCSQLKENNREHPIDVSNVFAYIDSSQFRFSFSQYWTGDHLFSSFNPEPSEIGSNRKFTSHFDDVLLEDSAANIKLLELVVNKSEAECTQELSAFILRMWDKMNSQYRSEI